MAKIDPILTEIIRNRLVAASDEMAKTLIRAAFNPLLYEVQDFSVTLMSATGDMWAETPGVMVFSQGFPHAVREGIKRWKNDFAEGDILIVNDPLDTGTHMSDTNVYMPIFDKGRLIAFCGVVAHWADIGGKIPGGWCRDTTEMYQEGIRFWHQKIVAAGIPNDSMLDFISCNVRVPEIVRGDLEAQFAACRQGARRVEELCAKYGGETVERSMAHVIDETDRAMRAMIAALPDGTYEESLGMDNDGVSETGEFVARLKVTIEGERVIFSLLGSSPTAGGPINLPAVGSRGMLASTLKGILLPMDPCNAGHSRSLEIILPEDSIVNPTFGAPTDSYGYLAGCLMELVLRCFNKFVPERCPAGCYQLTLAMLSRNAAPGRRGFVMADTTHGGNGALYNSDGVTNQVIGNGDLPNNPIEVIETRYPVRINYFRLAPEVSGPGRFRGGMGVAKEYEVLEPGIFVNFVTENTIDVTSTGVLGGASGICGSLRIDRGGDSDEELITTAGGGIGPLPVGTKLALVTGGGGGWGPAHERDPDLVAEDVRNGFFDPQQAKALYGVSVA